MSDMRFLPQKVAIREFKKSGQHFLAIKELPVPPDTSYRAVEQEIHHKKSEICENFFPFPLPTIRTRIATFCDFFW